MTSQTVGIDRLDAGMGLMAFVAVQPRHRHLIGKPTLRGLPMARKAAFPVGNELALLLRRKGMAHHAGHLFHAHAVDLPVLVAPQAGRLVGAEVVDRLDMTSLALDLLGEHVPRVADRFFDRQGTLRSLVPVAFGAGLPRRFYPVRLGMLPVRREHERYQEPVLFHHAQLMAILADHAAVTGPFPCRVRILHEMAAVAELRVLLDVIVIADGEDDAERGDDQHERDDDHLLFRPQPALDAVDYVGKPFEH